MLGALILSVLLLIYGFWASIRGQKIAKGIIAFLYLIYALALLALGISLLALKTKLLETIDDFMAKDVEVRTEIETYFECIWNETGETSCKTMVENVFNRLGLWIGIGLIALFVLLIIGDIVAWKWIREWEEVSKSGSQTLTAPLTYSW
jgi:hypothetical protein